MGGCSPVAFCAKSVVHQVRHCPSSVEYCNIHAQPSFFIACCFCAAKNSPSIASMPTHQYCNVHPLPQLPAWCSRCLTSSIMTRSICAHYTLLLLSSLFTWVQVYGFHAPMHQDQVRYASIALRGGEDSIMEPDLLAVSSALEGMLEGMRTAIFVFSSQ